MAMPREIMGKSFWRLALGLSNKGNHGKSPGATSASRHIFDADPCKVKCRSKIIIFNFTGDFSLGGTLL